MRSALLLFAVFLAGCASGYNQFYQSVPGWTPEMIADFRSGPPPKVPGLEHTNDQGDGVEAYVRKGYAVVGYSSFNSGHRESENNALSQGEKVGADLVIVVDAKYTGSVTTSVPLTTPTTSTSYTNGTATAYGPGGTATAYGNATTTTYGSQTTYIPMTVHRFDYGALYLIKRQIVLGANIRELNDDERRALQSNRGVFVVSVVDESPAFKGDILPGDVLVSIDGQTIYGVQAETDLLRQRRGHAVDVTVFRNGQPVTKSIPLAN